MSDRFEAYLRIGDDTFPVNVTAHATFAPPPEAIGTHTSMDEWGRLALLVPDDHAHHIGAHSDFGSSITLVDRGTETPGVFLMGVVGISRPFNAYLWMEPDHYHEWDNNV